MQSLQFEVQQAVLSGFNIIPALQAVQTSGLSTVHLMQFVTVVVQQAAESSLRKPEEHPVQVAGAKDVHLLQRSKGKLQHARLSALIERELEQPMHTLEIVASADGAQSLQFGTVLVQHASKSKLRYLDDTHVLQTAGVAKSQSEQPGTVDVQQAVFSVFKNLGSVQDWQINLVAESQELQPVIASV